jgi:membrane associated rhomboid family serine protease
MDISITLVIIIVTVLASVSAWNNSDAMNKMIFWPKGMNDPKEYFRFVTHGFIHADWPHLIFNMLALYFFGKWVESFFYAIGKGAFFGIMYLSAIVVASIPAFIKHRNNHYYRSLGASGGVAAVLFSFVFLAPWQTMYIWFIPMPSIVFAVGYLAYSAYMSRKGIDNVGHDAHFYGAVYGFAFTWIFDPNHGALFLEQLMHPRFNF